MANKLEHRVKLIDHTCERVIMDAKLISYADAVALIQALMTQSMYTKHPGEYRLDYFYLNTLKQTYIN